MKFSSKVPTNIPEKTAIDNYLANRFTYHSIEEWRNIIKSGSVQRNGVLALLEDTVMPNDEITYDPGEFEEPPANLSYKIIYEDEWYIGIDKPANLLVHRAGRSFKNNLIYQLRYVHNPRFPESHTVHRLDRDTSGVVLVAKSGESCAKLSQQFAQKSLEKEYVAVVHGKFDTSIKRIDLPICKAVCSSIPYKYQFDPKGKAASTLVIQSVMIGNSYSLLILRPLTGRTHQIRIHLAAVGNIIVGDKLYGMEEKAYLKWRESPSEFTSEFMINRHALHCRMLSFIHPYYGKRVVVESETASDMKELIMKLKKVKYDCK